MARHLCWLRPCIMQNLRADELMCCYKTTNFLWILDIAPCSCQRRENLRCRASQSLLLFLSFRRMRSLPASGHVARLHVHGSVNHECSARVCQTQQAHSSQIPSRMPEQSYHGPGHRKKEFDEQESYCLDPLGNGGNGYYCMGGCRREYTFRIRI